MVFYLIIRLVALILVLLLFFHARVKQHSNNLHPKYKNLFFYIDSKLTGLSNITKFIKPLKVGDNLYFDIVPILLLMLLLVLI